MKNKRIIFLIIPIVLVACIYVVLIGKFSKQENVSAKNLPTKEIIFTQEQLQEYYRVYEDSYVIALRTALNGYLGGSNAGMDSPQLVIESSKREGYIDGLSSFSNDYYESKFIVYAIGDSVVGGKQIAIIFQDKPDKLFNALVYKLANGDYDLRGFSQNLSYTPERMKTIGIQYKVMLTDTKHAL